MLIAMNEPILAARSLPRNCFVESRRSPFDFRAGFCFTNHGNYLRLSIDQSILRSESVPPSGVCPPVVSVPNVTA